MNMHYKSQSIKISQCITSGILLEASCYPSPGLVSPHSMGAHKDMNFLSFMLGSSALSPYFYIFAEKAFNWDGKEPLLNILRQIGREGEKSLLENTCGINTQRGILFLGGLICAASALSIKDESKISRITIESICKNTAMLCKDIVKNELETLNYSSIKTKGEALYIKYGVKGIRGEVESGLPSILNIGYPTFKKALEDNLGLNKSMLHCLLCLISETEDTTILSRLGMEGLKKAKEGAKKVLKLGSVYTNEGIMAIYELDKYFIQENISPGGSADLLACTIGIYLLEGNKLTNDDILNSY